MKLNRKQMQTLRYCKEYSEYTFSSPDINDHAVYLDLQRKPANHLEMIKRNHNSVLALHKMISNITPEDIQADGFVKFEMTDEEVFR